MPRATPLAGSWMLTTAKAPRTVSDRNRRGTASERSIACASSRRNWREAASLQCMAASSSAHNLPAVCASGSSLPSMRAPMPKRSCPRRLSASACSSPQGNGANNESQNSSSWESSCPLMPRGRSSLAIACSRGSAGGALPSSSSSSRSRHHASRIAPSRGSLEVETTSPKARSKFQSAEKASLNPRGSCPRTVCRSGSSLRSAIGDGLHRLDHFGGLDQRQLL